MVWYIVMLTFCLCLMQLLTAKWLLWYSGIVVLLQNTLKYVHCAYKNDTKIFLRYLTAASWVSHYFRYCTCIQFSPFFKLLQKTWRSEHTKLLISSDMSFLSNCGLVINFEVYCSCSEFYFSFWFCNNFTLNFNNLFWMLLLHFEIRIIILNFYNSLRNL